MIREMKSDDVSTMVKIAIDAEMFPEEASGFLTGNAEAWFEAGKNHGMWVVDEVEGEIVSVAFYEPREATDRVWYLTMLAVSPQHQGSGYGSKILTWVENKLRQADQRLLLIETSGTAQYDKTRGFYTKLGYAEVARVPGYFADDDDMVLFRKDLRAAFE